MSRWVILQIVSLVKSVEGVRLTEILSRMPLKKPVDHKGDRDTDMFNVDLDKNTTARILMSLTHCLHSSRPCDQKRKRLLVVIERNWREYSDYQGSTDKVFSEC